VQAIGFGFTSSAYVLGATAEDSMIKRLRECAGGPPVVTPTAAAVTALGGSVFSGSLWSTRHGSTPS
jgi:maleate isomerase